MLKKISSLALVIVLLATPDIHAETITKTLGQEYAKADSIEKLVLLSIAKTDRKVAHAAAQVEIDKVTANEVKKGKSPKERLEILGEVRKKAQDLIKIRNVKRAVKKQVYILFSEPSSDLQTALAINYISASLGGRPTLKELSALALVRKCTSFTSHSTVVLSFVSGALARDKDYMAADSVKKLATLRKMTEKERVLSDFERKIFEQSVLSEWISDRLKDGKTPAQLLVEVKKMYSTSDICHFSAIWAQGFLTKLDGLKGPVKMKADKKEKDPKTGEGSKGDDKKPS